MIYTAHAGFREDNGQMVDATLQPAGQWPAMRHRTEDNTPVVLRTPFQVEVADGIIDHQRQINATLTKAVVALLGARPTPEARRVLEDLDGFKLL